MKPLNHTILGFTSLNDFASTVFGGIGKLKFTLSGAFLTSVSGFITEYVYKDSGSIFFLMALLGLDAITGIWKALKNRNFTSTRLPRILLTAIIYCLLLSVSWRASLYSELFLWLPGAVYGGFCSTLLVSLFENFSELGFIPKSLLSDLLSKLKPTKKEE